MLQFGSVAGALIIAFSVASMAAANAETNDVAGEQYCQYDQPFAPDGVILKMAERFIRVCRPWSGDAGGRQVILRLNPDAVPGLENRYAASSLRVDERFTVERWREAWIRNLEPAGTRQFGPLAYEAYERRGSESNDLPTMALYIYEAPEPLGGTIWPSHWVRCNGEAHVPTGGTETCKVVTHHTDHLSASLLFITSNRRSPMPRDHFPFFAQEIVKVLDAADVTDQLENFEGLVEIVE